MSSGDEHVVCMECGEPTVGYCGRSDCMWPARAAGYPREDSGAETPPAATGIDGLLNEREKTHGDFRDHAHYTQAIKNVLGSCPRFHGPFTNCQREALDMIAHKIGRILAGDPDHKDHWDDIAGYAKLVSRELERGSTFHD